jgi:hypothetical protein
LCSLDSHSTFVRRYWRRASQSAVMVGGRDEEGFCGAGRLSPGRVRHSFCFVDMVALLLYAYLWIVLSSKLWLGTSSQAFKHSLISQLVLRGPSIASTYSARLPQCIHNPASSSK